MGSKEAVWKLTCYYQSKAGKSDKFATLVLRVMTLTSFHLTCALMFSILMCTKYVQNASGMGALCHVLPVFVMLVSKYWVDCKR